MLRVRLGLVWFELGVVGVCWFACAHLGLLLCGLVGVVCVCVRFGVCCVWRCSCGVTVLCVGLSLSVVAVLMCGWCVMLLV